MIYNLPSLFSRTSAFSDTLDFGGQVVASMEDVFCFFEDSSCWKVSSKLLYKIMNKSYEVTCSPFLFWPMSPAKKKKRCLKSYCVQRNIYEQCVKSSKTFTINTDINDSATFWMKYKLFDKETFYFSS